MVGYAASSPNSSVSRKPTWSLVHSGEDSTLEVAELFGVGRSTVYRAIERQRITPSFYICWTQCSYLDHRVRRLRELDPSSFHKCAGKAAGVRLRL
jgi:DNA-binding XRE family transcriptional regulator